MLDRVTKVDNETCRYFANSFSFIASNFSFKNERESFFLSNFTGLLGFLKWFTRNEEHASFFFRRVYVNEREGKEGGHSVSGARWARALNYLVVNREIHFLNHHHYEVYRAEGARVSRKGGCVYGEEKEEEGKEMADSTIVDCRPVRWTDVYILKSPARPWVALDQNILVKPGQFLAWLFANSSGGGKDSEASVRSWGFECREIREQTIKCFGFLFLCHQRGAGRVNNQRSYWKKTSLVDHRRWLPWRL